MQIRSRGITTETYTPKVINLVMENNADLNLLNKLFFRMDNVISKSEQDLKELVQRILTVSRKEVIGQDPDSGKSCD